MSNKLKIKLTKEFIRYQYPRILDAIAGDQDLTIEISEDQIVKEKSNVEKWNDVFKKFLSADPIMSTITLGNMPYRLAIIFCSLGYNADAAYNEVCGND